MADHRTKTIRRGELLAAPLPLTLTIRSAKGDGRPRVHLLEGQCVVGSGPGCDVVIDDPAVSRRHLELTLVPEGVAVKDLDSRNGTYYLGQRIAEAVLTPGARLSLGRAEMAIGLDEGALSAGELRGGGSFRGMTGASQKMLELFTWLARIDGSLLPVLITGETGVGKELVARAIHEGSRVAHGPFLAVNCGSIGKDLAGSLLFGHRRGAFTGAVETREGMFVAADGGTLMLDEIGELPLDVQPALLRVLETSEIVPVGGDRPVRVRVRIVGATNRDLVESVKAGHFRQDLYYRLAVLSVKVPPLRERREDIPTLARSFARQEGAPFLDDDIVSELAQRAFPGNVRELRNAVQAYVALGTLSAPDGALADERSDSLTPRLDVPFLDQREALVAEFTRRYLKMLLEHTGGNQTEAARIAGLDRTYLGRLLSRMKLTRGKPDESGKP